MVRQIVPSSGARRVFKLSIKSWVAYVRVTASCAGLILVSAGFFMMRRFGTAAVICSVLILVPALVRTVYEVLVLRSVVLFHDEQGVWLSSGVLPWSRGVLGVKWRDMEQAAYITGFLPYVLGSHTIRIGHRFTRTSEIVVHDMTRAGFVVDAVNGILAELARRGQLT